MQSDHRLWWSSGLSRTKLCGKCGQRKTLPQFPRDRSRPDGHWHCCKEFNGKRLRLLRLAASGRKKWELMVLPPPPPNPRRRLEGLKSYRNTTSGDLPFSHLEPRLRVIARQLLNKYEQRHRGPGLTQQKWALLAACAASNARRVGDSSWAHRMWRLKGWRRQRLGELRQPMRCGVTRVWPSGACLSQFEKLGSVDSTHSPSHRRARAGAYFPLPVGLLRGMASAPRLGTAAV